MSNTITFSGAVVAEPEKVTAKSGATAISFPVYDNEQRKNKETGVYENTGNVLKVRVTLWGDDWADKVADLGIKKGDIVEITGSITEREFETKDGGKGRSVETTFVNDVTVKWSKPSADHPAGSASWGSDPF
jgi:single-strand DNA-binding protein